MTLVGSGAFTYAVQQDWFELPEGWNFGWIPAVACDSADRVYVYSRSEHPWSSSTARGASSPRGAKRC